MPPKGRAKGPPAKGTAGATGRGKGKSTTPAGAGRAKSPAPSDKPSGGKKLSLKPAGRGKPSESPPDGKPGGGRSRGGASRGKPPADKTQQGKPGRGRSRGARGRSGPPSESSQEGTPGRGRSQGSPGRGGLPNETSQEEIPGMGRSRGSPGRGGSPNETPQQSIPGPPRGGISLESLRGRKLPSEVPKTGDTPSEAPPNVINLSKESLAEGKSIYSRRQSSNTLQNTIPMGRGEPPDALNGRPAEGKRLGAVPSSSSLERKTSSRRELASPTPSHNKKPPYETESAGYQPAKKPTAFERPPSRTAPDSRYLADGKRPPTYYYPELRERSEPWQSAGTSSGSKSKSRSKYSETCDSTCDDCGCESSSSYRKKRSPFGYRKNEIQPFPKSRGLRYVDTYKSDSEDDDSEWRTDMRRTTDDWRQGNRHDRERYSSGRTPRPVCPRCASYPEDGVGDKRHYPLSPFSPNMSPDHPVFKSSVLEYTQIRRSTYGQDSQGYASTVPDSISSKPFSKPSSPLRPSMLLPKKFLLIRKNEENGSDHESETRSSIRRVSFGRFSVSSSVQRESIAKDRSKRKPRWVHWGLPLSPRLTRSTR